MPHPADSPALRRTLAAGAAAGVAVLSARALLRPRAEALGGLIDWETARRIAADRSGERGASIPRSDADRLAAAYDSLAAELAPTMAEVCQAVPNRFPAFTVVDRRGFIDTNVALAQRLFEPLERARASLRETRASALSRAALSRYVGEIFGLVSRRVLGQYDPVLLIGSIEQPPAATALHLEQPRAATALYLVEPNIVAFERAHPVPATPLRRWLILHELTHAWQFESHPWLRQHIATLIGDMIANSLLVVEGQPRPHSAAVLRRLPAAVRGQLAGIGRIQAIMSVLEGYSNFLMHRVGRRHIAEHDRLERAFHQRRRQRTALERLLAALTGMNMKLRQYDLGEQFAVQVADRTSLALLNRVWEGPELMPSLDELRQPSRWIARVGAR